RITLATGDLDNRDGLVAGHAIQAATGAVANRSGASVAVDTLALDSGAADNEAGRLQAGAALALGTHGPAVDDRATGSADRDRQAGAEPGDVEPAGILSGGRLAIGAGTLDNWDGRIVSTAAQAVQVAALLDNRDGTIAANAAQTLQAATLDNRQ